MTKRKVALPILIVTMLLSFAMCFVLAFSTSAKAYAADFGGYSWTLPSGWSTDANGISAPAGSGDIWDNTAIAPSNISGTSYTMEVTAKTTNTKVATKWGIMPYYKDANNFIIIWLEWTDSMFEKVVYFDTVNDAMVNGGNDTIWTDNSVFASVNSNLGVSGGSREYASNQEIKLKVVRSGDTYNMYFQGVNIGSYTTTSSNAGQSVGSVGLCSVGDATTFSSVIITDNSSSGSGGTDTGTPTDGTAFDKTWTLPSGWSTTTNSVTTVSGSGDIWNNAALAPSNISGTSYTMEATAKTTNTNVATKWGIMPYYKDSNNFIIIWLEWTDSMFEKVVIFDTVAGGKVNSNDTIWTDNSVFASVNSNLGVSGGSREYASNQDIKLKVVRSGDTYNIYFQGVNIGSYTTTSSNAGQEVGNVGLCAVGDVTTFSNVTVTDNTSGGGSTETPDLPSSSASVFDMNWSLPGAWSSTEDTIITNEGTGNIYDTSNVALVPQTMTGTKYSWEVTAHTANNGKALKWGIIPYYKDANNYIVIWAEWTASMFEKVVIFDTVAGGKVNSNDTTWTDSSAFTGFISGRQYDSTKDTTITVERNNNLYTVSFNGHVIVSYNCNSSNANNGPGNSLGFCASGDVTTVTNAKLTNTDTPTFGYYWDYDPSIWVTTSSNISVGTKNTVENVNIISTTNKLNVSEYTMSVTMQGTDGYTDADKGLGVVPWMLDNDTYILVRLSWNKTHASHADKLLNVAVLEFDGSTTVLNPDTVDCWMDGSSLECAQLTANKMCKVVIKRIVDSANATDNYEIYINGELVRTYASTLSYNKTYGQKIGLYAWEDYVTFSNVLVEEGVDGVVGGLYEDKEVFDKTVHLNTDAWTVVDNTLVGKNTTWMENYATTPTGLTGDYVFEATIKGSGVSTDTVSNEIQFGFIPWYVDSQNYILVMLKWDSLTDEDTMTHKAVDVNGLYDVHIIHVYEGTIPAWNDYWIQDPLYDYQASRLKSSDEITVKIEKVRNPLQPNNDTYKIYINGEYIRQVDYKASVTNTGATYVGVHTLKDTNAVVSAMSVTPYVVETDTPTINPSDNMLYTNPDFVDLYTGEFEGKYYENGVVLTGIRTDENKYYKDGTLYTGKAVINDLLYNVNAGVMTLLSGEYEGKMYVDGIILNGIYENKYYENGVAYTGTVYYEDVLYNVVSGTMTVYTGIHTDGKYYSNGTVYTGIIDIDGILYNATSGILDLYNGLYNEKYYLSGELFSGITLIEGKLYNVVDGQPALYTGAYDGKLYDEGLEISPTTNADDGKLYTTPAFTKLYTGEFNGKYYVDGELYNGYKDIDGKIYKYTNGEKSFYTGVYEDKYYVDGSLYTGIALVDNKAYTVTDGVMSEYTGEYLNKYYENGVLYSGIKVEGDIAYSYVDGVKTLYTGEYDSKYYQNGNIYSGYVTISSVLYYVTDGVKTEFTGEYESKYYEDGLLFTGIKELDNVVYNITNGEKSLYNGEYDGKIYVDGVVKQTFSFGSDGKLYVDGNLVYLYTGIYENKYYVDGDLAQGEIELDGILYTVTDGVMVEFTGKYVDDKYYADGVIYSGTKVVDGILYEIEEGVMTKFLGTYEGKYYEEGLLYTGFKVVTDIVYYVTDGVMELYTGEYNGKEYLNGIYLTSPTVSDGKLYTDGSLTNLYTGIFEGKYYVSGVCHTGIEMIDGILYEIEEGVMTKFLGAYEGKYYEEGVLFTGFNTNKLYVNGVLYSGVYEDNKLYANGDLFNGINEVDGKLYQNGIVYTGVYESKQYQDGVLVDGIYGDGKVYAQGVPFTGIYTDGKYYSNGLPGTADISGIKYVNGVAYTGSLDGKEYEDGVLLNGEKDGLLYADGIMFEGLYTDGKYYKEGIPFTGLNDGICYKNGALFTGNYEGKRYSNGELFTGKFKNQYYVDGEKLASGTVVYDNLLYTVTNGTMRLYTGVYNGKYYTAGLPATTVKVIEGIIYQITDGIMTPFTGEYGGNLYVNSELYTGTYTDGKYYSQGKLYNGTNPEDGKLYRDGELFNGVYDDNRLYVDGEIFTGTHTDGIEYENGLPVVPETPDDPTPPVDPDTPDDPTPPVDPDTPDNPTPPVDPDDGSVDLGGGGVVDDPNAGSGNGANDFFSALVPWGIIVLCIICVIPFFINMIKKGLYKIKK